MFFRYQICVKQTISNISAIDGYWVWTHNSLLEHLGPFTFSHIKKTQCYLFVLPTCIGCLKFWNTTSCNYIVRIPHQLLSKFDCFHFTSLQNGIPGFLTEIVVMTQLALNQSNKFPVKTANRNRIKGSLEWPNFQ